MPEEKHERNHAAQARSGRAVRQGNVTQEIERAMGPVANPGAQQHQVVTGTDKRKLPEPR
jgi:hypothetical protein